MCTSEYVQRGVHASRDIFGRSLFPIADAVQIWTNDATSIGEERSGGCIRLRDEDMKLVWDLLAGDVSRVEVRE